MMHWLKFIDPPALTETSGKLSHSAIAHTLLLTAIFSLCYTLRPLYTDNQTTKFLHGLAQAGRGHLQDDWLANTIDPLPVFSGLVQFTATVLSEYIFYGYTLICFGVYIYCLVAIAAQVLSIHNHPLKYWAYLALLLLPHTLQFEILGEPIFQFFHFGLADQYALGHYFQPSMLGGVLILWAILQAMHGHSQRAVIAVIIAATVHPAYLPSSTLLVLAMMLMVYRDRHWKRAVGLGVLGAAGLLPVTLYMTQTFAPTAPDLWARSQEVLVTIRIPHHSLPDIWLRPTALLQLALMGCGLYLARRSPLVWLMAVPMAAAAGLTVLQIGLGSHTLAFTAPWRVSAFLMPIALSLACAQLVTTMFSRYQAWIGPRQPQLMQWCMGAIALLVLGGTVHQAVVFWADDDARPMMNFVHDHRQPGQTYLIPMQIDRYWHLDELWNFRLYTGVPIYVNFKSHPYKDVEVLEWYRRVELADRFYQSPRRDKCAILDTIRRQDSITNVVLPNGKTDLTCDRMVKIHADDRFAVYELTPV